MHQHDMLGNNTIMFENAGGSGYLKTSPAPSSISGPPVPSCTHLHHIDELLY